MPAPEADITTWFTHSVSGLIGAALVFLLQLRKLTGREQADMLGKALARITNLETQQEAQSALLLASLGREADCRTVAARQEERIKGLETEVGEVRAMLDAARRQEAG